MSQLTPWTDNAEAARLIADCAANPPRMYWQRNCFDDFDHVFVRADKRVKQLHDLRDKAIDDALIADDRKAAKVHWDASIEAAIHAAMAERALAREAA